MKRLIPAVLKLLKKLFTADYPYCIYCDAEYGINLKTLSCPACEAKAPARDIEGEADFFRYTAGFLFEGPVKDLVHRYKYSGAKYLGEKMALLLTDTLQEKALHADSITNVPLHRKKRRKRGYDQSEVLARALAEHSGIPYESTLKRIVDTPTQTNLDRSRRIANVKGAFETSADVRGKCILLVDDVLTTGSTAAECARTLLKSGAREVRILTFAKAAD